MSYHVGPRTCKAVARTALVHARIPYTVTDRPCISSSRLIHKKSSQCQTRQGMRQDANNHARTWWSRVRSQPRVTATAPGCRVAAVLCWGPMVEEMRPDMASDRHLSTRTNDQTEPTELRAVHACFNRPAAPRPARGRFARRNPLPNGRQAPHLQRPLCRREPRQSAQTAALRCATGWAHPPHP